MTNSTTQITTESSSASESPKNPFIPFFPNFNFNFQLPPFFFPPKKHNHDDGGDKNKATNVVTFPKTQLAVVSEPLQVQSEISSTKTSNPLILYQVYFSFFFLLIFWFLVNRNFAIIYEISEPTDWFKGMFFVLF